MSKNISYQETMTPSNYSGVTINITSPTVNANTGKCTCSQPLYCADVNQAQSKYMTDNYTNTNSMNKDTVENSQIQRGNTAQQAYPPQYYMNNYNYATIPPQNYNGAVSSYPNKQMNIQNGQQSEIRDENGNNTSQEIIDNLNKMVEEQRNLEKNGKETKIVALTNEYIKSLENYLNNPNTEIRLLASQEILTRFDEDRSRYNDRALNALINKMLQDPEKIIRTAAMSALSSDLASGNDYTVKLLNEIQKNPDSDQTDVVEAANILLKKSTVTESRYVKTQASQQEVKEVQQ